MSVQRNLKILGIFVRLYKRDKKDNYLKFLPHTWKLIERRLGNPVLKNFKTLFYKHLPVKKLKKLNKNMNIKHAMILAAGLGRRMQPITIETPKPLLEINNTSLLERAINLLINHGVEEISINLHHLPDKIQSFISKKKFNVKIRISNEADLLLDTGGGVLKGTENFGNNPFIVINPDTIWSKNYLEELKNLSQFILKIRSQFYY